MMFEKDLLKSKRVLTTGGGTGLGRSIGDRYLALGADLVSAGCANPYLKAAADRFARE
jgi:NAD(P)-dependent dehydrogenase (short-subunit alcohol dehydrogenase family)